MLLKLIYNHVLIINEYILSYKCINIVYYT